MAKPSLQSNVAALRSIVLLLSVALLGWLAAKYFLPGPAAEVATESVGVKAPSLPKNSQEASAEAAGNGLLASEPVPPGATTAGAPDADGLQALLRLQTELSQRADVPVAAGAASPNGISLSDNAGSQVPPLGVEQAGNRSLANRQAMLALQTEALAEIQSVRPGDTQSLIRAVENFDRKMRDAGAPALLDLDGIRKTLHAADRIQQLNSALVAEANKGREANPETIQALSAQLHAAQKSLSNPIVKTEVLKELLKP